MGTNASNSAKSGAGRAGRSRPVDAVAEAQAKRQQALSSLGLPPALFDQDKEDGRMYQALADDFVKNGSGGGAFMRLDSARRILNHDAYAGLPPHAAIRLAQQERDIHDAHVEWGVLAGDAPGVPSTMAMRRTDNMPNEVVIPTAPSVRLGTRAVASHNHPNYAAWGDHAPSFSGQDFEHLALSRHDELRAVGHVGDGSMVVYRLRRNGGPKKLLKPSGDAMEKQLGVATAAHMQAPGGGYVRGHEARHRAVAEAAAAHGWTYSRHYIDPTAVM